MSVTVRMSWSWTHSCREKIFQSDHTLDDTLYKVWPATAFLGSETLKIRIHLSSSNWKSAIIFFFMCIRTEDLHRPSWKPDFRSQVAWVLHCGAVNATTRPRIGVWSWGEFGQVIPSCFRRTRKSTSLHASLQKVEQKEFQSLVFLWRKTFIAILIYKYCSEPFVCNSGAAFLKRSVYKKH